MPPVDIRSRAAAAEGLVEHLLRSLAEHDRILIVLDLVTIGVGRREWRDGIGYIEVVQAVRRLPDRLGPLPDDMRSEVERTYAVAFGERRIIRDRPLRAPHHTASAAALAGSRRPPRPGEAALAHGGILYLEDLGEFAKRSIEDLAYVLDKGVDFGGFAAEPYGVIGVHARDDRMSSAALETVDDRVREFARMLRMERVF